MTNPAPIEVIINKNDIADLIISRAERLRSEVASGHSVGGYLPERMSGVHTIRELITLLGHLDDLIAGYRNQVRVVPTELEQSRINVGSVHVTVEGVEEAIKRIREVKSDLEGRNNP